MHVVETVVALGVAAMLATTGYRVASERRDAARVAADLGAVAALAVAYRDAGVDCGRAPGTPVEVETMSAALGRSRAGPTEPGGWRVRYYAQTPRVSVEWPPSGVPHTSGFAFDVIRGPEATEAEQAVLERLGGRREGASTALAWRADVSGTHRARRSFAAGRAHTGC